MTQRIRRQFTSTRAKFVSFMNILASLFNIIMAFVDVILCTYRSWAPDRTLSQARKYVEESLGRRYAEGVILDLQETWSESDPKTPLVCFLSMGSDPTVSIEQLAKRIKLGMLVLFNYFAYIFTLTC